jgi:hypothetical protein
MSFVPSHETEETLIFYAKTKNAITEAPEKSKVYKIVRERRNDENSSFMRSCDSDIYIEY